MFYPLLILLMMDEGSAQPPSLSQPSATEHVQHFENNVRPLLHEYCLKCHGSEKQWAGLRLDSRQAILKGGDSGPAAIPHDPDASLLIKAVRHEDENLQMPQDAKLTDLQIESFETWIRNGMDFPESVAVTKRHRDPDHWAFQPRRMAVVPVVIDQAWPKSDLDRFVLAEMESRGLIPAPRADKRTLIRRVTFDLTGLPPTPNEIDSFLADDSEEAYSQLVDRLLESPAYGERWGRHWLDVARYADSNGLDENIAHGNAWRYRDYVVNSFNGDKPFDRFILEQLAGDQLEITTDEKRQECLIATGFLSIGPKVLAEVNMPKMRMDIVDEQIDTVGRVFMGMTFGCARCHDHKFDPIDATDYYGLAGIFKSTRTMETYTKVARWHEYPLKTTEATRMQSDFESNVAAKKQAISLVIAAANEKLKSQLNSDQPLPESPESLYPDPTRTELAKLREELSVLEKSPPEMPSVMGVAEDQIADVPVHVRGNPAKLGATVPRHVPQVIVGPEQPAFTSASSGRLELAQWLTNAKHPLTSRVLANRFWRWHFGKGIVRSTDNFGLLGERPTHPELLDWLADQWIQSGWSLKAFHRIVLNSSTYQQSSAVSELSSRLDPDNLHWSRYPVRRLEAEEIRDAILFVSGQLDQTRGGSLLKVKNRGYLFDHTSIDTTDYNSPRRSLYLPVIRNNVYELFQLLDFPDPAIPTGDRATTTVAPQALMMMNSDFVMQAADRLATNAFSSETNDVSRLQRLYLLCLGREPSRDEIEDDLALQKRATEESGLRDSTQGTHKQPGWSIVCQVLLASSEFVYIQ